MPKTLRIHFQFRAFSSLGKCNARRRHDLDAISKKKRLTRRGEEREGGEEGEGMEWCGEGWGEWADGLGGKLVGEGAQEKKENWKAWRTKLDLLRRLCSST